MQEVILQGNWVPLKPNYFYCLDNVYRRNEEEEEAHNGLMSYRCHVLAKVPSDLAVIKGVIGKEMKQHVKRFMKMIFRPDLGRCVYPHGMSWFRPCHCPGGQRSPSSWCGPQPSDCASCSS